LSTTHRFGVDVKIESAKKCSLDVAYCVGKHYQTKAECLLPLTMAPSAKRCKKWSKNTAPA